jgi:hypothetical protein
VKRGVVAFGALVALVAAGCGSTRTVTKSVTVERPASVSPRELVL